MSLGACVFMNLGFVFFLGILLAQTRAVMLDLSDEKLWLHLEVAHGVRT